MELLDVDVEMLEQAGERLARFGDRAPARRGSFLEPLPECDAVAASLALHHVPTMDEKAALFARIHDALRPGGVFVNADVTMPTDPAARDACYRGWADHLVSCGIPEERRSGTSRSGRRRTPTSPGKRNARRCAPPGSRSGGSGAAGRWWWRRGRRPASDRPPTDCPPTGCPTEARRTRRRETARRGPIPRSGPGAGSRLSGPAAVPCGSPPPSSADARHRGRRTPRRRSPPPPPAPRARCAGSPPGPPGSTPRGSRRPHQSRRRGRRPRESAPRGRSGAATGWRRTAAAPGS